MAIQDEPLNFADFKTLEMNAPQDERWELIHGRLFRMMAGGTLAHNTIVQNIAQAMRAHFRARKSPCRPYTENVRVDFPHADLSTLPDIVVVCGPQPLGATSTLAPIVIVEVLSRGTADRDDRIKGPAYRALPTLLHFVRVDQEQMLVVADERQGDEWRAGERLTRPGDVLSLRAIDFAMPLSEVYEDVFPVAATV